MHLSSAWLQTKENLLPVYGGRDFDLWFSFSSLSLSLRWIFSREASSFLSDFLALISTLFFFSPAFRELGRDCSSRLSETCSLTCPLPPTFSTRFLLPLSRYLLYFPFFLCLFLWSPRLSSVWFLRGDLKFDSNFFPNFFPFLLQGEDSSNLGIPRILNVQSKAISIQISASRGAGFFSNFQTFDLWLPRTNGTNPGFLRRSLLDDRYSLLGFVTATSQVERIFWWNGGGARCALLARRGAARRLARSSGKVAFEARDVLCKTN